MKKSDLKTGMMVKLRNGRSYLVLLETSMIGDRKDILFGGTGHWMPLSDYNSDMHCFPHDIWNDDDYDSRKIDSSFDIMKVYEPVFPCFVGNSGKCKLIYDREEVNDEDDDCI